MIDRSHRRRSVTFVFGLTVIFALSLSAQGSNGPVVQLSPNGLNFPSQVATTSSAPQNVTLTNIGNQPLTVSAITTQGVFSQTNTCPTTGSLAANASCTFMITFAAPNGGPSVQPGLIEIADNATPGLQVISLSGTVADFSLAASPSSATVSPGTSASYTISATGTGGFNQAVSFTCGALPTGAACSFSPSSITPGATAVTTTLTVSTSAGSLSAPNSRRTSPPGPRGPWIAILALGVAAGLVLLRYSRRRLFFPALAVALLPFAIFFTTACGGGSSGGGGGSVATPAGTYTVLITGSPTAGPSSLANPSSVTLVVN